MKRVTLRIPRSRVQAVEAMVERGEFPTRSEAIRTAVRDMVREDRQRRPIAVDGGEPR